jgi:hypothetical protein
MAAHHPPLVARLSCRFTPVVAALAFVTVAFVTPRLAVALLGDGGPRKRSE